MRKVAKMHVRIGVSLAALWLCIPGALFAQDNDVSVVFEVSPSEQSFEIPPIPDPRKPSTITVTFEAAPGWRIVRLGPAPEGWFGTYQRYHDGTSPENTYRITFSGTLEPEEEKKPKTYGFTIGGPANEPEKPIEIVDLGEAARQREVNEYGEGFVDYRDARSLHLAKDYRTAILRYDALIEQHNGTVYAEAAQLYRAQCMAAIGEPEKAVQALKAFVDAAPLGLYRGEAKHEIGRILLDQGDPDAAEKYFEQVLAWIENVREQDGKLQLPAVPEKAARITTPPAAAQTLTANYILQPAKVTPSMVINRREAPWHLTRLEWDTRYYLGFIAFYRGQHDKALAQFNRVYEMNPDLQAQFKNSLGSFHRRLEIACRVRFLLARQEELRAFNESERLRFMLADFYTLWEKWDLAGPIYREFLDTPQSSREIKACTLRALGEAQQYQGRWSEAIKYFQKVVDEYSYTPSGPRAILSVAQDSTQPIEPRVELLMALHERSPHTEDGETALYKIGFIYLANNRPKESVEALKLFVQRYPHSRFTALAKNQIERQQE